MARVYGTPEYIAFMPWVAVEWSGGGEVINGMDGTFQVFVDDTIDETMVCDAHNLAEAEDIAAQHNLALCMTSEVI